MEQNVGRMDRRARIAAGATLLGAALTTRGPVRRAAALGAGGTMLATGATGYCPAYDVAGVDTRENDASPDGSGGGRPDGSDHTDEAVEIDVEAA
ncbi:MULTISPECIES: DUF2892 domain-containing protein [Halobellus]|uniref:YgaP family membrane protein n=1 Tax=Halobellus TaxID=1073986 RepID=UPI0021096E52|nr:MULTISPECIES: DUF2892 domain-containing protein [Halobellus]MDQ2053415.1 DUF2892 domain-containing protein [Halobellus sp. H-GB7]